MKAAHVSLPYDLWQAVKKQEGVAWWRKYGYRSPTDFVIQAIRKRLEDMRFEPEL